MLLDALNICLLLIGLGGTGWIANQLRSQHTRAVRIRRLLLQAQLQREEAVRMQQIAERLIAAQGRAETVVAEGAELVRAVHKGLSRIPFEVFESIPVTRETTKMVRATHDLISDGVFESFGALNKGFGLCLREAIKVHQAQVRHQLKDFDP
ncbi:MAG: hypothetical protein ACPGZP_08015 [Panacagrimonas sp.]